MESNSSTPSTSNMTVNKSNFTESNVTMKISTQSKSREPPTNNISVQGNITNSNFNMQIITESMPRELSDLYGFPDLPETVDKRESDVEILCKLMSEHHKVVITGIGGHGKTTLANLCARKWVEDGTYHHAIFVNMETEESASGVYKRLAKNVLNTKDDDYSGDTILEIYKHLNKDNTLLVFDNIDENCVFHKYYQKSKELTNIHILGTSQFTELERRFHPYPLQELSEEASVQLILDIFSSAKIEVPATVAPMITDLVVKLWFHPLALQHAAALVIDMCTYNIPKMSLEQSLNKYKQHFETKLKERFPTEQPSEYRKSVYAAISLNIEKATIGKEHVKSLLHCMTYLDPSRTNIDIFYKAFSTHDIQESLRELKKFSLISVHGDVMISMHRLVPQVCHAMITADNKIKYLNKLFNIFFYNTEVNWISPFGPACYFFIEHFEVNFDIKKEELAAYYKAAFYSNDHIKERLSARLQMINCVISDAEGWSVQQCCVFAGHRTFYKYFNGTGNTINDVGFIQVIRNSSLDLFGCFKQSILIFFEDNKKELNKPIFKGLTMLSICVAFDIDGDNDDYYDDDDDDDDDNHNIKSLIDMGCDVNITDNNGMTPILWAARNMLYKKLFTLLDHDAACDDRHNEVLTAAAAGDGESVLRLLQTSEISFAIGEYGKTLLWWAARMGHHNIVHTLIEHGTDTSGADGRGNTLLHMVASGGYDGTVSQFIHAVGDINIANSVGHTALILAASKGHDKIVSELISAKADINITNSNGTTALILAAHNGHDKIVMDLIGVEANVNTANSHGDTALIVAAEKGHKKIILELIDSKADVNFANSNGETALILAAMYGHDKIVSKLIAAKVNVNIADRAGDTALIHAAMHGCVKITTQLAQAGANVNVTNNYDQTPLLMAAMNGHHEVVTKLFNLSAHVDTADQFHITPLLGAAKYKHYEISMYLIQKGASVNVVDRWGNTPLYYAARDGDYELALELINRGARTDTPASNGGDTFLSRAGYNRDNTPLSWAQHNGDVRMEHIITSKGRRLN